MPPNATAAGPTATPVSNTPPTPTTTAAATAAVGIGSSVGQIPTRLPTTPIQMMPVSSNSVGASVASPIRTSTPTIIRMASPITSGAPGVGVVRSGFGTNVVRVRAPGRYWLFTSPPPHLCALNI